MIYNVGQNEYNPHIEVYDINGDRFICWREPVPRIGDMIKTPWGNFAVISTADRNGMWDIQALKIYHGG